MRVVFELKEGELGVAMNYPKTVVYLVRLVEIRPSERLLRTQFEVDRRNYYIYFFLGSDDRERISRAWMNEIRAAADLRWIEPKQE